MPPPKKGSDNRDVLSSLPRSRPQRPSARREKARAAAKPKAQAPAKPTAKAAAAKPKTAPAGPKAPPGAGAVPPAGYAAPQTPSSTRPPSGTELISTAVQAAGELVQIGATLGSQALKSALSRLPRP